jgi:hypothetical protein
LWIYIANKHGNADVERNAEEAKDLEIITNENNLLWAQYLLQVFFIYILLFGAFFCQDAKIHQKKTNH